MERSSASLTAALLLTVAVPAAMTVGCRNAPDAEPSVSEPPAATIGVGRVAAPDGASIAYESRGAGEVTLVFVHGWMCDQSYWRHQVAAFKDRYRIVTVDLPGHGKSSSERQEWTLEAYGADVAAVVDHLDLEKVVLVGHSMGGAVILEAAVRLGDRVAGLIGVETLHNAEFEVSDEQWQPLMEAYRQDFAGTCRQMVAAMFPAPEQELALEVQADMCGGPQEVGVALMERFGSYRAAEQMARIEVPIRAINAEISLPTLVEANRRHAPQFDAVIQRDVGHFPMLEAPERFNQLFDETLGAIGI